MFEFTKEELHILIEYLDYPIEEIVSTERNRLQLVLKIQAMIDGYPKCDHRSGLGFYNEKGERIGFETDIYRCRHCDILFKFIFKNGECIGHEELE